MNIQHVSVGSEIHVLNAHFLKAYNFLVWNWVHTCCHWRIQTFSLGTSCGVSRLLAKGGFNMFLSMPRMPFVRGGPKSIA